MRTLSTPRNGRLVEEIKASLDRGRRVQVYAVYTQKRDVTRRLEQHPGQGRDPGCRAHDGGGARGTRSVV